jgi:hypothetical protein
VQWAAGSKLALGAAAIPTALVLAYFGSVVIAAIQHGYSWREMDWDNSGATSISEFFKAADTGRRRVVIDGKRCVEFFAYKDGLPLKTSCAGTGISPGRRNGDGE